MKARSGATLLELMVAMAILAVISASFVGFIRYAVRTTVSVRTKGESTEAGRQALMKLERALTHANEVRVASATFVEFVCDIDQSPLYDGSEDTDGDGIDDDHDADRDGDAMRIAPAATQWRYGFNLRDDDEDGDSQVDVVRRIYVLGTDLWLDSSVDGEAWGGRKERIGRNIASFSLAYYGNKSNSLGSQLDRGNDGLSGTGDSGENDGVISSVEMDMTAAPAGMGNRNGVLDLAAERRYITSVRIYLRALTGARTTDQFVVETDVYPPLLPLKSR